ncbi:Uncharacterised protein [Yersinia enterocolitica]|nr:Uncharacterised protein [Yersinia enterocolitica]
MLAVKIDFCRAEISTSTAPATGNSAFEPGQTIDELNSTIDAEINTMPITSVHLARVSGMAFLRVTHQAIPPASISHILVGRR